MNKKFLLSISTAALLITGCGGGGGGGGSSSVSPSFSSISGSVIDPEIKNSRVRIICGQSIYNSETTTDGNGRFKVNVPKGKNINGCTIEALGGEDAGDDLSGLTLKSKPELFTNTSNILITPLTTAIAEHNSNDIEIAKQEVANFFGLSKNDVTKNPLNDMNVLKVTKKMTKIAIKKDTNGKSIGFIDIDDTTSENTFNDYIANDFNSNPNISDDEKDSINDEFTSIDNSNSLEEIKKNSYYDDSYLKIKQAYKKTTYSATERQNLKYLANKVFEAYKKFEKDSDGNTIPGTGKYRKISRSALRAAFKQADLVPTFSDQAQTTLDSAIETKIGQNTTDFKNLVDAITFDIADIEGIIIWDVNEDHQALNTNEERIAYYAFSNVSNIANALKIVDNSFADTVNDPVNAQVANALAKYGFYDDALEIMKEELYLRSEKINGYKSLGYILANLNQDTHAAKSFYEMFLHSKEEIESVGKAFASGKQIYNIQLAARKLGINGDTNGLNEATDYLKEIEQELNTTLTYSRIVQEYRNMAQAQYLEANDLVEAKKYAIQAGDAAKTIPTDRASTAIFSKVMAALYASIFEEHSFTNSVIADATAVDSSLKYLGQGSSTYQYLYTAALGLTGDYAGAKAQYESIVKSTSKRNTLIYGYAASLMLNDKADELFNDLYVPSMFSGGIDYIYKYALADFEDARIGDAQILHIRGENAKLIDYLDRLTTLIDRQDWVDDATESDLTTAYTKWDPNSDFSQGSMIQTVKWYKRLNETAKATSTIAKILAGINNLSIMNYKLEAHVNFLVGIHGAGLTDLVSQAQIDEVISRIITITSEESADNQKMLGQAANWLAFYNKKDEAKVIVEKLYSLIEDKNLGHLETIEDRVKYLVGKYNSAPRFKDSVAGIYFQIGDLTKTREFINEALADVNSLVESTDQYKLLIDIANAYAAINDYTTAATITARIKTTKELEESKIGTATYLANFDAFINSKAASVDSDNDGKPDFWNISATATDISDSGLTLDDDIDNDGTLEPTDTLPYDGVN